MSVREESVRPDHSRVLGVAAWTAVALYAWIAGSFPSFTWAATAAVLLPGVAIFLAGTVGHAATTEGPPPRRVSGRAVLVWSVPVGAFCVLEVVNDMLGSTYAHPTLSVLMDPVLTQHPLRSLAIFGWLVGGWRLVQR